MIENNNGGVLPSEEGNEPKLTEVEVGDKKVLVSEDGKDLLMTQADYTRKTQAHAEERKAFEEERKQYKQQVETAQNFLSLLAENEKAAKVMEAVISGNESQLGSVVGKAEEVDELEVVKRELDQLKQRDRARAANEAQSETKKRQYLEAKKIIYEKYGKNIDDYYDKMEQVAKQESNTFEPWFLKAAQDDLLKAAVEKAREEGRKEALGELSNKMYDTPVVTSGRGVPEKKEIKNPSEATKAAAFELWDKNSNV